MLNFILTLLLLPHNINKKVIIEIIILKGLENIEFQTISNHKVTIAILFELMNLTEL
jgi:hypothetical protein